MSVLLNQSVVLCGGLGTRLKPYTDNNPKPMVLCNGKPFLYYLLDQLYNQGFKRFLLLTGYLGDKIQEYFGDGSKFGWKIDYSHGPKEWDTGRRLWEAKDKIDETFFLMYSDNFIPFNLEKLAFIHKETRTPLTFMVTPKVPGNINLDDKNIVQEYNNNRSEHLKFVEIGYMIVEKKSLFSEFEIQDCSLSYILKKMATNGQISALKKYDKYHSISDPERWKLTEKYLEIKKIILIDRDGVINQKAPRGEYISKWKDFIFLEDTKKAMIELSKIGFQFIVISNQAGLARGMITPDDLEDIHKNMVQELKKNGVEVLKIYYCPHHWDEKCECRKPKAGMLFQASEDFNVRLDKLIFIGDDIRDAEAAWNAGANSILIQNQEESYPLELVKKFNSKVYQTMSDSMCYIQDHYN